MKVVVGLGNPGAKHARDRHNVGAMVVDRLAAGCGSAIRRAMHRSYLGEVRLAGERVLLVKPQTYMNLSGNAVASIARYYRLDADAFVAVYDDMDLPVGRVRVRRAGGAAGHRGVASLMERLGDRGFARVRVGIGRPPAGADPADYVLSPFAPEEQALVEAAIARAADATESLIVDGPERAMNRFNGPDPAEAG